MRPQIVDSYVKLYQRIRIAFILRKIHTFHDMYMSRGTGFPTMWYVRPAKPQISLCIRAV